MNTPKYEEATIVTCRVTCPKGHKQKIGPYDLNVRPIYNCSCGNCKPDEYQVTYECKECKTSYALVTTF